MPHDATVPPASESNAGKVSQQMLLLAGLGVLILAALLVIVIIVPEPKPNQAGTFRVVLAIGAACFGAILPGVINLSAGWMKASGAAGFFAVVLLLDPSGRLTSPLNDHEDHIAGLQEELAAQAERAVAGETAVAEMKATTRELETALTTAPASIRPELRIQATADLAVANAALAKHLSAPAEREKYARMASEQATKVETAIDAAGPDTRQAQRVLDGASKVRALRLDPLRLRPPPAPTP